MKFVTCKHIYPSLLINSRLKLRFKNTAQSLKLLNIMDEMSGNKNILISDKTDVSLSFIGLEVLGNTSTLSPCSVSLNTTSRSYLFNCGEGLQKIMSEYKIRPSKYRDIFITYPSWKNIGGIIGTALSMQESNVKLFTLHGHSCLEGLFSVMKNITNLKGIKQSVRICDHGAKFSDEFIAVEFIHLHQSPSGDINKCLPVSASDGFDEARTSSIEEKSDLNQKENFSNFSTIEYENKDSDCINEKQTHSNDVHNRNKQNYAISFIIQTAKSQGSLSFEKCMDLGVPVGPLLGKLKKGEDVELENGTLVRSSDVKFPDLPGVIIIVVECPTEDYLDALLNEPAFFKHQSNKEEYYSCAVVHFSNSKIINSKKYHKWINQFSEDTKHVFVNEASEIGAFVGLHRHQFKLNMVHAEIFPLLQSFGIPDFPRAKNCAPDEGHLLADVPAYLHEKNSPFQIHSDKVFYECKNNSYIMGETLCEICLKPKRKYDYSKCLTLKKNEYMQEVLSIPNFRRKLEELKRKVQSIERTSQLDKKLYPRIVFLGTGSKKPSKTRNSSGILVFLSEDKLIILDCGESSYCQLLVFFGKHKTKEILRNLSAIYISHLHIDHHLGLFTLLIERKKAFDELKESKLEFLDSDPLVSGGTDNVSFKPVHVIAPVQILPLLHYLSTEIYGVSDLFTLIPCSHLIKSVPDNNVEKIITDLNLESLQTVAVKHAPNSFGVSLKHKDGWKLTYSGDTKPCENLVKIGQDSDVLIHEATFDDVFQKEAEEKLHTTTGQAILIGRKMNAKFILLTHFSQRYCHLPMIKNELLSKRDVGVAFDFMQVSPYQFPILPYLYEPLKLVFSIYQEKLEHRDAMMKLRKDRDNNQNRTISEINERPLKIPRMKNS